MLVKVGNYRLALRVAGMSQPAVLLEAGAGLASDTWDQVQGLLARFSCVIRYDRAGLGASEPAPPPRTCHAMVSDLHALFQCIGIGGPYVLVGHSFGGLLVRVYAHYYPAEVVGMVLVDAMHHDQNHCARALLPPPCVGESPALATLRRNLTMSRSAPWLDGDREHINWPGSEAQGRAASTLDARPLVVLTQGRPLHFCSTSPADLVTYIAQVYHPMFLRLQADLARLSSRGIHIMATHSGHMIHQDEPDLVVESIRMVVEAVQSKEHHLEASTTTRRRHGIGDGLPWR